MHEYLTYRPPPGVDASPLWVETTSFRRVDVSGQRVDYMGQTIGDDFIIPEDYHSSGRSGIRASRRFVEAAGLYQPASERDVQDAIVGNVLAGLDMQAIEAPVRAELEAHLQGQPAADGTAGGPTRSYLIVSNLYTMLTQSATAALDAGDFDSAMKDAAEAEDVRREFPVLVLDGEPLERVLLARAQLGKGVDAHSEAAALREWYAANAEMGDPPTAFSGTSAEALLVMAAVDVPSSREGCEATYGAVLRFAGQFRSVPWASRFCSQLAAAPACAELYGRSGCE